MHIPVAIRTRKNNNSKLHGKKLKAKIVSAPIPAEGENLIF
jgi:hypothetical protein